MPSAQYLTVSFSAPARGAEVVPCDAFVVAVAEVAEAFNVMI